MKSGYYCHYQDLKQLTYFQLKYLIIDINESTLSSRTKKLLKTAGIEYLHELVQNTEEEILMEKDIKKRNVKEIKEFLKQYDLFLGMIITIETISNLELHKKWTLQKKQYALQKKLQNQGISFLTMPLTLIAFYGDKKKGTKILRTINSYTAKQLASMQIKYFYQLIQISKVDLLAKKGIGKKFVEKIEDLISHVNTELKDPVFFLGIKLSNELIQKIKEEKIDENKMFLFLMSEIRNLSLSIRTSNSLQYANIEYIYQLIQKSDTDLIKLKHFGRKSLREVKKLLSEMNFSLYMKLSDELIQKIEKEIAETNP